jgi:predicted ArsR family transcriptional regulator
MPRPEAQPAAGPGSAAAERGIDPRRVDDALVPPQLPSAGATTATPNPSTLRREILLRLRTLGPASPDALAATLGASRTGVLQQLRALESAGLVSRQTVRHGVGRPRHLYDVTPDAQELFPSNYDGLASGLLAAVRSIGGDALLDEVLAARRRQLGERIQRRMAVSLPDGAQLADRVRELAVIQDEQGYLAVADIDAAGAARLIDYNCAIYHVARDNPAACRAELELFREVLGGNVVRESHIASGDRCCSYRVLGPDAAD